MKILCVADHVDPLIYTMSAKERFKDIDLVLSAGDLPMEYLGFISSMLNRPILFVFGNHNLKSLTLFNRKISLYSEIDQFDSYLQNNYGSTYTGWKVTRTRGLLIAGLGGSMRYNDGENQYTDFQMYLKILKLIPGLLWNKIRYGRYLDILLTHAAPFGIQDQADLCHRGFRAFLWFMRVFKPRYLIHGHVHLYDLNAKRVDTYYQTQVINAYDHCVIEIDVNEINNKRKGKVKDV
ncbi:MAG TPA: metallophosphoesterase [Spirochaetales bacterium]|nr:metallophosphoesterase [Spirochaetales bacterium]HOV37897.1 metallophosphoesterase [Spirochaetales bacterium]